MDHWMENYFEEENNLFFFIFVASLITLFEKLCHL